jgi:hypothetical protein
MVFRLRYKKLGGHIHCRLFEAMDHTKTYALNGTLTFDERSWPEFLHQTGRTAIEVIPEDEFVAALSGPQETP